MDKLLAFYEELIKSAEDHQVGQHLQNLASDVLKLTQAIEAVVEEAKQRVNQ